MRAIPSLPLNITDVVGIDSASRNTQVLSRLIGYLYSNLMVVIVDAFLYSYIAGVGKLRPVGHKWPTSRFLVVYLHLIKISILQYFYVVQ